MEATQANQGQCERCDSNRGGASRWCPTCGFDSAPETPSLPTPEAWDAASREARWISENESPAGWAPSPGPPPRATPGGTGGAPEQGGESKARLGPPPAATIDHYRSLRTRGWLACRWLGLNAAISLVTLLLSVWHLTILDREPLNFVAVDASNDRIGIASFAQIAIYVIGFVIFLTWLWRAYSNLPGLGVPDPRFRKGWAIGSWFVPFLNLFRPKQIVNDTWRAADPDRAVDAPSSWRDRPLSPLLNWWWAMWLLTGFVANYSYRLPFETVEEDRVFTTADIVSSAVSIVAAVLAWLVVRRTTARQEARAERIRAAGGAPQQG